MHVYLRLTLKLSKGTNDFNKTSMASFEMRPLKFYFSNTVVFSVPLFGIQYFYTRKKICLIFWIVQYVCLKVCTRTNRELCRETVMTPATTGMLETAEFSKAGMSMTGGMPATSGAEALLHCVSQQAPYLLS